MDPSTNTRDFATARRARNVPVKMVNKREPIGRSENMRRIRSRDTKAEIALRRALYRGGLRYRVDYKYLPGKPDIVFTRAKVAVFVHGCFWHQHPGCREASKPRSNTTYWRSKLAGNVARDERVNLELTELGYCVVTAWECEIERDVAKIAGALLSLVTARCKSN